METHNRSDGRGARVALCANAIEVTKYYLNGSYIDS
jgi:hypothetical protein